EQNEDRSTQSTRPLNRIMPNTATNPNSVRPLTPSIRRESSASADRAGPHRNRKRNNPPALASKRVSPFVQLHLRPALMALSITAPARRRRQRARTSRRWTSRPFAPIQMVRHQAAFPPLQYLRRITFMSEFAMWHHNSSGIRDHQECPRKTLPLV